MTNVLITGGSGFIGTNLVERCLQQGAKVLNVDIAPVRNPDLVNTFKRVDVLDYSHLEETVQRFSPDCIFHLAARTDLNGSSLDDYRVNTLGVQNLLDAASHTHSVKRIVFASSMYVCRLGHVPQHDYDYCPHTFYGESKVIGEQIVRKRKNVAFTWAIVRPTSIWGPWFDIPYKDFFVAVKKGIYFHPKGKPVTRSYGFVLNTVAQLMALVSPDVQDDSVHGKVFYLADYVPLDVKEWADTIARAFNTNVREVPFLLLRIAAGVGDLAKRVGFANPPLTSFRLRNMLTDAVFDLSAIRDVCTARQFTLEEGVGFTVDWLRRYHFSTPKGAPVAATLSKT